jgi:hypothetical protein
MRIDVRAGVAAAADCRASPRAPRKATDCPVGHRISVHVRSCQAAARLAVAGGLGLKTSACNRRREVVNSKEALTRADILGPGEAFRGPMDYFAHAPQTVATLHRLAQLQPRTLACMHGSAWTGDGSALLRHLAEVLGALR